MKAKRITIKVLFYAILIFGALVSLVPFLYMFANSIKTYSETVTRASAYFWVPEFWPTSPQWQNFMEVLQEQNMGLYFKNSVVISLVTLSGVIVVSSMAAYSFAKIHFPGKNLIFSIMLLTLMIPETVLLIPNFLIISRFGWIDKLAALSVPFMGSAFFIFLLRQFFIQIPDSIIESAVIDGASHFKILRKIVIPLTRAPLFTVAFLAFNGSWNALQWPMVVTQTDKWRPITVGLTKFLSEAGPETHLRMAGATIALIPIVIIYLIAQKQITEAIASTGLKG